MSAVISSCGKYRYRLTREFFPDFIGEGALCFVMLNPSTADAENDDPTIRRCIGYAKSLGMARLEVVNLFAYRSTDPAVLSHLSKAEAVGPDNDQHILDTVRSSKFVICGWGNNGTLHWRDREVKLLIGSVQMPHALKINRKTGQPAHPLYLKSDARPVPMI